MRHTVRALLATMLAPAIATAQTAQAELVSDTVFTRMQSMTLDWARQPPFGPLPRTLRNDSTLTPFEAPKSLRLLDPEDLVAFVREAVDADGWNDRGASLVLVNGQIEVRQTRAHVDEVRRVLQALDRAVAPRLRVEVVLFDRGRLPEAPSKPAAGLHVVTAAAAGELRLTLEAARAIVQSQTLDLLPNSLALVGREHRRGYVAAVYEEGLQSRAVVDPHVGYVRFGTSLGFLLQLHPDGKRVALFGVLTQRDPGPPGKIAVRTKEVGEIDRLTTVEAQLAFSLNLDEGSAVVLVPGASTAPGLGLLLRLERPRPIGAEQTGILAVPTSLLTSTVMESLPVHAPDQPQPEPAAEAHAAGSLRDALLELMPRRQGARPPFVHAIGEALFITAEDVDCARARACVEGLAHRRARSFVVTLRCQRRAGDSGEWQALGEPMVLPVLAERQAALFDGRGQTHLRQMSIEDAGGVGVLEPQIGAVFDGREVLVRVLPGVDDCQVEVDLTEQALDGMRTVEQVDARHAPLEAPQMRVARLDRTLRLSPGSSALLGSGVARQQDGKTWQTRWSIELVER